MEIELLFDPSNLTDAQKNELLNKLFVYAHEYPNYLACSQPYSKGYRDGCYQVHDYLCMVFENLHVIKGFDPND